MALTIVPMIEFILRKAYTRKIFCSLGGDLVTPTLAHPFLRPGAAARSMSCRLVPHIPKRWFSDPPVKKSRKRQTKNSPFCAVVCLSPCPPFPISWKLWIYAPPTRIPVDHNRTSNPVVTGTRKLPLPRSLLWFSTICCHPFGCPCQSTQTSKSSPMVAGTHQRATTPLGERSH
jgi:hypothetical protein